VVSIQTGVTLALVAVAAAVFFGLGGASGIGGRIGGGFRAFGQSITEGIAGTFNPFAPQGGNEPAPSPTRPEPTCGPGTIENPITGQCEAPTFGGVTPSFARFDISNLFSSFNVQQRLQASERRAAGGISGTPFGGFGSAQVQETALQAAIEQSRRDNPVFFR